MTSGGWRRLTGVQLGMAGMPWLEYVLEEPVTVLAGQTLEVVGLGEESILLRVDGQEKVCALRSAGAEGVAGE